MGYHTRIGRDALQRAAYFANALRRAPLALVAWLPQHALAANTKPFVPVQTVTPQQAESVDQEGGSLDFNNWVDRGMTIRGGDSVYQCLANLTAALELVGQLSNAEYSGAAGALSLLPTAGALLGAPTREMWIVYKLVPLAGLFSMFLSLGGSITPSNVGEYDPSEPFSYGGYMPTTGVTATRRLPSSSASSVAGDPALLGFAEAQQEPKTPAVQFAEQVKQRADDDSGGGIRLGIFGAMALQFILMVCLLIPMWYAQKGAVVTWWCRVRFSPIGPAPPFPFPSFLVV
jgi:hypothetical protein